MISKTVFVGTPQFSVPTLSALIHSEFKPSLVITQPDRPKGRKLLLTAPEVKIKALEYQIPCIQPEIINNPETILLLREINPDIIITISYGGFIGREIRKLPLYGVLNIHPSLLPLYRGSIPIQSALLNGDTETAISIFRIISKMDAGPVLFQNKIPISSDLCFTELETILANQSAIDLIQLLRMINTFSSYEDYLNIQIPQSTDNISYTSKVSRETLLLNWNDSAINIVNKMRAFSISPAVYTYFRNNPFKIIKANVLTEASQSLPGTITSIEKNIGIVVSTSDNDILITQVQAQGKRIMTASEFHIGARIEVGEIFTNGI